MAIHLTHQTIKKLVAKPKRYRVQDSKQPSLYLNILPSGHKSFVVIRRKKGGKPQTVTLGAFPEISLTNARQAAEKVARDVYLGILENHTVMSLTLQDALNKYLDVKPLTPITFTDYQRAIAETFSKHLDSPLIKIHPTTILALYDEHVKRSAARTNNAMGVFRAVYNYHRNANLNDQRQPILPPNPVTVLSTTQRWVKVRRNKQIIRAADLKEWRETLGRMDKDFRSNAAQVMQRYITAMFLTGLRGDELRRVATEPRFPNAKGYYDKREHLIYWYDQKNHLEAEIPLPDALTLESSGQWLFERNGNPVNYPNQQTAFAWLNRESGIKSTGHTLRRTYITVAESLDLSPYTYKRLVGHISDGIDVTGGYIAQENHRLRTAANRIAEVLLR